MTVQPRMVPGKDTAADEGTPRLSSVTLPQTDPRVSQVCLGSTQFGTQIGHEESFAILDAFAEAGGTFVDTAHVYANWIPGERHRSETTIGARLARMRHREQMVVATKGGHHEPGTPTRRLAAADIVSDLDHSLACLGIDAIDLNWLHRDDPDRPTAELLETLDEQAGLGKIRHVGCSNWRPDRIREAHAYADAHGIRPFVASLITWSIAVLNLGALPSEHTILDEGAMRFYATAGMAVLAYSPQARGFFTKANRGGLDALKPEVWRDYENPETLARLRPAQALAARLGTPVTAVVLAYVGSQPFVGVPIVGCATIDQVRDCLAGAELTLAPDKGRFLPGG